MSITPSSIHLRPLAVVLGAAAALVLAGCGDTHDAATNPALAIPAAQRVVTGSAQTGSWSEPFDWPVIPIHLSVLPDGKVLSWSSADLDHTHSTPNVYVWDRSGATGFRQIPNTNTDLFCSAHSFLPDGRLLVMGGHIENDGGAREANIFNSSSGTWGRALDMRAGRWYPASATLGNGDVVVVGGNQEDHALNPYPEVWTGSTWRLLGGAPLTTPWYPWLHVAPDGRVFMAGPDAGTKYLNPSGTGEWIGAGRSQAGYRSSGSSVTYAPGKVLIVGGGDPPTNMAETIDLNVAGAPWERTAPMRFARRHLNAILLADGKVLVTGGTEGAGFNDEARGVLPTELWNPATGQWTLTASIAVPRTYHSTAVLLPDARVLSGGGGRCGGCLADRRDAQLFSPPYLFNADGSAALRPTITGAPASIGYGQSFVIATPNAADIGRVTWVRLPSATHSFDMNQRFNELDFSAGGGQLTVTAPANGNLAPPGHYMLFVLTKAGVPSKASIVQIQGAAALPAPPPAPAAPGTLAAVARSAQRVGLTWADGSTSETGVRIERCQGAACTGFTEIAAVGPNVTQYSNTGLAPGATYRYRVRAENGSGTSPYSNVAGVTTSTTAGVSLIHRLSARCVDVAEGRETAGTGTVIWSCHGAENQQFLLPAPGTAGPILAYGTMCLDAASGLGNDNDPIVIWTCHGGANQRWTLTASGELQGIKGKCIDVEGGSTANGARLLLRPCSAGTTQQWDAGGGAPVDEPPVARFTATCTFTNCTFDGSASTDDRGIVGRIWDFGDGTSATNVTVIPKNYSTTGSTYTVTMTVTDGAGQSAAQTQQVTVVAPPQNRPPVAAFTSSCTALACTFTDASTDDDGTVEARSWTFGDGSASNEPNPSHSFANAGTYTVTLAVTDDRGATSTASKAVTATAPATSLAQPLIGRASGKCLDVLAGSRTAGTHVVIYTCNNGESQKFTVPAVGATGEIRVYDTMCLQPATGMRRNNKPANGDTVVIDTCRGATNQQWTRTAIGELRGPGGRCLDVLGGYVTNLAAVGMWSCNGGNSQRWTSGTSAASAVDLTPRPGAVEWSGGG